MTQSNPSHLKLWYTQPATQWVEALPLGNGRLGAMVFGGIEAEQYQLNEETLWSGAPRDWNSPGAQAALPGVRAAIANGDYEEADRRAKGLQGAFTQAYQPLGDLHLEFAHGDQVTAYYRDLDLTNASSTVRYTVDGVTYTRESFVSKPADALVIRLTADQPGALSLSATLDSPHPFTVQVQDGALILTSKCPIHSEPSYRQVDNPIHYADDESGPSLNFAAALTATISGGQVQESEDGLLITKADEVILYLTAASGFVSFEQIPGLSQAAVANRAGAMVATVTGQPYADLHAAHLADYQPFFNRVTLDLGSTEAATLPTDARIRRFQTGDDPALIALLFQYGRYLLIASSRPGGHPANLQGIWNDMVRPPWSSNYTININTQNYPQYHHRKTSYPESAPRYETTPHWHPV